ncbi:hypothetical protein ACLOJK_033321 [Asimina triloba]
MGFNFLTSSLPVQLANLTSLAVLELSNSHLQGAMPYLPQLQKLYIGNNPNLSVDLAYLFAHPWPYLTILQMPNTHISQSIPPSMSNATSLSVLLASGSYIQGPLPNSLFNLSSLWYLDLGQNSLTGNLSSSISRLKNLQFLLLYSNTLSGQIPASTCQVSSLQILHLPGNRFTGSIPNCIGGLTKLFFFLTPLHSGIEFPRPKQYSFNVTKTTLPLEISSICYTATWSSCLSASSVVCIECEIGSSARWCTNLLLVVTVAFFY